MWYLKLLNYIEPIWLGTNNKISIRRVLALIFSINLSYNISRTISDPKLAATSADIALLLGVEAGLIAALMSLTTYSTHMTNKKDSSTTETD